MGEKLHFKDFDILGIISLQDVQGIEKYVTPVIKDGKIEEYLSRSKEYYNVKSMTELALEREQLKAKLTKEYSKRNFVILENMLNCSGKVYFKKFQEYILSGKSEEFATQLQQAEEALLEDTKNLLVILQNEGEIKTNPRTILPVGEENSEKRSIEMDNKAMLYTFLRSLKFEKNPEDIEVLKPGYGSIYIGPFLKAMYGYNFTNILKSKYIEKTTYPKETNIGAVMSSDRAFESGKTLVLLDDNIGTGLTMLELNEKLAEAGIKPTISGAIQYNWRNYYRVSTGDKTDIERFDTNKFDIISPYNYAGHKLYKHAIDSLISSGASYINYLKAKSYLRDDKCDLKGALDRGVASARASGIEISENYVLPVDEKLSYSEEAILPQYRKSPRTLINPISTTVVNKVIENTHELLAEEEQEPNL